jgi:uncharacterized protein with PIN domain
LSREAVTVTASTTTITMSDVVVAISGMSASCRCPKCNTSLTPMNAKITDRPVER